MAEDPLDQVYHQFRTAQDKYIYFLLAAAGAGIGLAINQTRGATLAWSLAPLGGAVLAWGASFYFGCRFVVQVLSSLYSNLELIRVERGVHPLTGSHSGAIEVARDVIQKNIASNSNRTMRYGKRQFGLLVFGGILYLAWSVIELCK